MSEFPHDHPERLLKFRGSGRLWEKQIEQRQKVIDRIRDVEGRGIWTGQAKSAKGQKYPQLSLGVGKGMRYLANARHIVFYLANGWVDSKAQQYRVRDGDPMNVHPQNLVPVPPIGRTRASSSLWGVKELRQYFG
ncbi:MAG: hypothetical protein H8D69_01485 [Chloroflexi bacterium]|nr:hypothetical protein [Chloroflexota bacterium]